MSLSCPIAACKQCPRGQYQPGTNATTCLFCDSGSFTDQPGQVSCQICQPGTVTNDTTQGAAVLVCCALSHMSLVFAACVQCGIGRSQGLSGQSSCNACTPGTYANVKGMLFCQQCLPGSFGTDPTRGLFNASPLGSARL